MRKKKIIVVIGIMLLSIMMFGCKNTLKIPKNLELKDEYSSQVSKKYAENFIKYTEYNIKLYDDKDIGSLSAIPSTGDLGKILFDSRSEETLTEYELFLGTRVAAVYGSLIDYCYEDKSKEVTDELEKNMKTLLDLYK